MEPQIRYCTSADGTRIAYSAVGQGTPLLLAPGWGSSLECDQEISDGQAFHEILGRGRLFVKLDFRGIGFSQRDIDDISLETLVADIAAVADHAQLQQFSLWGSFLGAATAIAYAAQYPERVFRLVLWGAYARGNEITTLETMHGLIELARSNWTVARRTIADFAFPSGSTDQRRWYSNLIRKSISPEILVKYLEMQVKMDVSEYLPLVKAPTLILHRRNDRSVPFSAGRSAATFIQNSNFLPLEGDISHSFSCDASYMEIVLQFLKEGKIGGTNVALLDTPFSENEGESDPLVGKTISHYKILEKLGEGGMGVVYKAEDTILHRPVALKFLPQDLIREDETRERFFREARAAAALDHSNICTVYEIAEDKGQTFIAMAHIEGQGLDEKIKSGPLKVNKALDITIQIAEGLRKAHRRGIIHRDIKSANIIIDEDGQAKILDFGLAKLAGQTRLTKTATIMGTVAYMSPEQAHGEATIDHHTDIWSLGVLIYEMLAGRQPFDAPSDAGLIHKIIYEEPEPLSRVRTDIPIALEQAIKKTLQKDPKDRYEDVGALISDLKSIRSGAAP